jgi:FkbH-like protein/FkbM family methyltransferase
MQQASIVGDCDSAPIMKYLLTFLPDPLLAACAEFRVSTRSLPFLADHAFQDVVVLPGSFYIDMALSVHQEVFKRTPVVMRNVSFRNPVILSAEDTVIRVEVRNKGADIAEYTFYETAGVDGSAPMRKQYAATLEIDFRQFARQELVDESFSLEGFRAQAHEVIESDRFYSDVRAHGNQYGPHFRCVSSIWRAGNQSLSSLSRPSAQSEPEGVRCRLLDAMTQTLAPFMMSRGRTFVLHSIDRIEIANLDFPSTLWCHATLRPEAEKDSEPVVGDIRAFDSALKTYLILSGVAFILLDRTDALDVNTTRLVVASNFTAEPIEDSLKFWSAYFNLQTTIEFAPYDQVFQQLLQSDSAFRRNSDGVNLILLQLEKWAAAEPDSISGFDKERREQSFGKRKRYVLPNGLEIVHLNSYETDYIYHEIFEHESYLKHGLRLPDGATVLDIGANIGLFSLFVMSRCRNPKIYAFEPAPLAYECLKANCEVHGSQIDGSNIKVFNLGVADRQGTAAFTFYPNSSVFSSFHSDEAEDRQAIQTVVRNMLTAESSAESAQEFVNELTSDRLRRSTHECRLTTVSEIIRQHQIDRIDLLKIDAEKSELDIIEGIGDCDWAKIDQIVMEIHDRTGDAVRRIKGLLARKGYRCAIEQEKMLEHSGLFNLFATRDQASVRVRSDSESLASSAPRLVPQLRVSLQRNVRDFCTALQSFTSQSSAPVVLCCCPASPAVEGNAELNAALAEAEKELLVRADAFAGVSTISSQALLKRYPVAQYYDIHNQQMGDIPYTPECYAAIGTSVIRTIFNLKRKPFKVIVLDCDNTLWKGVCGEDGWRGLEVSGPHRILQQFMLDQMKAGMLLCLCSKNREQDVLDVFDERADMLLKREHLVSWRINWNSKSQNIKSLASELNLGLDSFVFVDDDVIECKDVEINCPDVLTLRLPQDSASFASFLEHIWAFDHAGSTQEDRSRVRMYQDNAQRETFRAQTASLKDFVAGVMVRVEIAEATVAEASEDQLSRVSQLTFRTNQFNFTTIRRSPSEIRDFLQRGNTGCLIVRVTDRFGDYGQVGVVLYETGADRLKLDTFLLSCRVLGRGVEHTVLSSVGERALGTGKRFVELSCLPTERNLPAREFVSNLSDRYRSKTGESWLFPAEYLAGLRYNPDEKIRPSDNKPATRDVEKLSLAPSFGMGGTGIACRSDHLQRIGEELWSVDRIANAIDEFRLQTLPLDGAGEIEPSDSMETTVLGIWRKVLGRRGIGVEVNFFEAGGSSLKAVQVIAMIRKELKQSLSITTLFECPTVRLLAGRLRTATEGSSSGSPTSSAALRGQLRRSKAMSRTRSQSG